MDVLAPQEEATTSAQALRKALLSLGSDCSEADFPTEGGFSEHVPIKVLILTQATHRLFEAFEDGTTKVPSKRRQVVSGPWVPAENVAKAGGATGKPAQFPSISRSLMLSMRGSTPPTARSRPATLPHSRRSATEAGSTSPEGGEPQRRSLSDSTDYKISRRRSSVEENPASTARTYYSDSQRRLEAVAPGSPASSQLEVFNEDEAGELSLEDSAASECSTDDEVIVGPTPLAVQPLSFSELSIPGGGKNSILSGVASVRISEVVRLKCPRGSSAEPLPLSYGSILHICGHEDRCRPCMFERSAGRCRKSWLCDFCHMHTGRKRKVTAVPWQDGKPA